MYAHFTLDFYLLKENIIKTKRKIIPPEHDITPVVLAAVQILYLVIVSLYNLKKKLLPSRLPRDIEQSFLCYTVGLCWLSILNIAVYTCQLY